MSKTNKPIPTFEAFEINEKSAKGDKINAGTVLIDNRDGKLTEDDIRQVANQMLGIKFGPEKVRGGGYMINADALFYYNVNSVSPGIVVASKKAMTPDQTRPIAQKYIDIQSE